MFAHDVKNKKHQNQAEMYKNKDMPAKIEIQWTKIKEKKIKKKKKKKLKKRNAKKYFC